MVKNCRLWFRYFAIILLIFPMTACNLATEWMGKLGFDTYDYTQETVTGTHTADSETGVMLKKMISILTASSGALTEFDGMNEALLAYRDTVLTYMLKTEYARYSGNQTLIEEATKEYPEYQITQIIPAKDFEAIMYQYFGGNVKISHKNGQVFRYLRKVDAYISSVVPADSSYHITLDTIEETDKTYRVHFSLISGAETETYFALIVKREDGTHYFKQLTRIGTQSADTGNA